MSNEERIDPRKLPVGSKIYRHDNLVSQGATPSGTVNFEFEGVTFHPGRNSHWKTTVDGLNRLRDVGRLAAPSKNSLAYVRFLDDFPVAEYTNVWPDTQTGAFTDDKMYVVQTNAKVIERCMVMTTDPGDLVLDPTCGSGTTAFVAEKWGRRWITADTSRVALTLARQRIIGARFPYYVLADRVRNLRKGFVYKRIPHVTLKSIATNPDIEAGMTQREIDAAIAKHAESEILYDQAEEDTRKVRVAGPFTVESLSPHSTVAPVRSSSEQAGTEDDGSAFEKSIVDNLLKAGVQNGRKAERLLFDSLTPYAGEYIQAEGVQRETEQRIAVSIGPRYGTVDAEWVRKAAREATRGLGFDLLLVCAFSFDPQAANAMEEFSIGRVRVLLVRMNSDLAMGDVLLKKTGSGNLFTVFGEPDVAITREGDDVVVEIKGVDVYNPTTGEIRSSGTGEIALWMIDTDYDGESFFVRHCYFTGGNDPYKRLKAALKADIDPVAWKTLYQTKSRPFPKPEKGKIAVKVINHYGDEVLQVYEV
jgi:adenine-specific DNA-methyltransferase